MKALFVILALLLNLNVSAQVLPDSNNAPLTLTEQGFHYSNLPATSTPYKLTFRQRHAREVQVASRALLALAAGGTAGFISYHFVDEPMREFSQLHRSEVSSEVSAVFQPLGRSKYMIPAGGLVYASGLAFRDPKMQRTGVLLVSSLLLNDLITSNLKDEFQRRRPNEANHNSYFEGGEGGRHFASFPSAHTSTAFTFATSLATVYQDHKWVPPVAYSVASLVGLSRIHDNKHWTTDVLAGATVGFLTAKTTNFILTQVEKQLARQKINIYVLPSVSNGTAGLRFGGSF